MTIKAKKRRRTITNLNQYQGKIADLKAKIVKLKQDKQQLRLFLHEIIEAYYRTINQEEEDE